MSEIPFRTLGKSDQEEAVRLFFDRFAGRLETYAIRVEGSDRAMYLPSVYEGESEWSDAKVREIVSDIGTPDFTDEVVRVHLEGRYLLGVYPINKDGKCNFFALDFDGKNGDPWTEALNQVAALTIEAGIPVYLERSQSGNGFHIWGFLDEPVEAHKIRHALKPFIEKTDTYDRMFPNQDSISDTRKLGNLIALPLAGSRVGQGNSSFVFKNMKGQPEVFEDQFQFLRDAKLVSASRIEELFREAGEWQAEREVRQYDGDPEGVRDGWKITNLRFGCEFMRWAYENPHLVNEPLWYAIACNLAQVEGGRDLFHEISAQDTARYNPKDTDKKYDQALRQNKPHSCEKIRELGGPCECDRRFPGVYHPFELAKLTFKALVDSITSAVDASESVVVTAAEGFRDAMARAKAIEADPTIGQGWKYGIPGIDRRTGLRGSDLIILAARPGMGKTAFMNTVIDNTAMAGVPNYAFSAEMSKEQFFTRQLVTRAGISATRVTTGTLTAADWKKMEAAQETVSEIENYPLFVDDMSRSTDRIFEVAARLVHLHGKGIIWIDYLQLLQRLPKESMFEAVTRITHDLKLLAKALDCPVVALTQLNRTADDATDESQTQDSWLRGSGDIEQAADVIVFLLGDKGPEVMARAFALHKERHREAGMRVELEFNQPLMRFADKGTWGVNPPAPAIKKREDAPRVGDDLPSHPEAEEIAEAFDSGVDIKQLIGNI